MPTSGAHTHRVLEKWTCLLFERTQHQTTAAKISHPHETSAKGCPAWYVEHHKPCLQFFLSVSVESINQSINLMGCLSGEFPWRRDGGEVSVSHDGKRRRDYT